MTIDHNDFLRVRDNIIERFEECDKQDYDALCESVDSSLVYSADIFAVIVELVPVNYVFDECISLATLAFRLMYDYVLEDGYVEVTEDWGNDD